MNKINLKLLNLYRKRKRYIDFIVKLDPTSKEATPDKGAVQQIFINLMKQRRFEKLFGKIAVDITAYSSSRDLPHIHNFVKNILDIMHKEEYLVDAADEPYLPFKEDKHIKYLRAKYVLIPGDSSIHFMIQPFSSFLSDVRFAGREIGLHYKKDADSLAENQAKYRDVLENKDKYLRSFSPEGYEALRRLHVVGIQQGIADSVSITPEILRLIYPGNVRFLKETYADWMNMLVKMPIFIQLPGIPVQGQEEDRVHRENKRRYKQELRKRMAAYLEQYSILEQLLSPILVSVFYMPPKSIRSDYKDVDNIMREYVMPAMNEIFTPPSSYFNLDPHRGLDGSCIGYEVIELPRCSSKEKGGFLSVGLKMETMERSIMAYIENEIDNYIENKNVHGFRDLV